ncbi:MAG: chloride channel protein [Proteobacteria bacterium]|nr:chloride channel protein [Pseudomonadota bacterium]
MTTREAITLVRARWHQFTHNDQVKLSILALIIGIGIGYGALGFRMGIEAIQNGTFGFSLHDGLQLMADLPWWLVLVVPTVGGLAIGLFVHFLMPGQRAYGVADVIEAGARHGGRMNPATTIKAAVLSLGSIGVGASVGREGPVIHLGAGLASWVAQRLHLNPSLSLTLLGCGLASAIGASFNAPIAGVFFALEVVIGHYALHTFAPVVIAAVAGTVISRIHLGAFPAFVVPNYDIASFFEFPAFILLGLVCALAAILFIRSITTVEDVINRIGWPIWTRPMVGGAVVGGVAIFLPHVMGVGYAATDAALQSSLPLWLMLALIVAKTATTAVSIGSRFGGGVFSPSLFVGAMVGGAFGVIAGSIFPGLAASPGFYAMIGMGAVAAPVIGAPISTILIAFELTGEFSVVIAAMVAITISTLISQQVAGRSFFHAQLKRRGIVIRAGRFEQLLTATHVGDLMTDQYEIIEERAPASQIREIMENARYGDFFVVDGDAGLVGSLTFNSLRGVSLDPELDHLINARDIARLDPPLLCAGDDLEDALKLMETHHEDSLPVVTDRQSRRVVGILHHKTALMAYNQALLRARAEEHDEDTDRL